MISHAKEPIPSCATQVKTNRGTTPRAAAARWFLAGFYKMAGRIFVAGGIEATRALRQGEGVLVVGVVG
jgi:hypothetical protein